MSSDEPKPNVAPASDIGEFIRQRALQLRDDGLDLSQAWSKAWLEHRTKEWPAAWGDELEVLIYGDFDPPEQELRFTDLGIVVYPKPVEHSVLRSARTVLKARVAVTGKNVPSIVDAARRINVLLGAWTLVTWGNSACRWWSWITHDSAAGIRDPLAHDELTPAVESIIRLPDDVRKRVDAALYWIRESRNLLGEFHRPDLLRIYSAYWNAFECLVEAIALRKSRTKLTKHERQKKIDEFFSRLSAPPTARDIENCYKEIVNPGFVAKASHALNVCFGDAAEGYIKECFTLSDKQNRLYDIRNAINHGTVDAENPEELIRIESRLTKLWIIVWGIFGRLVEFSAPRVRGDEST